MRTVQSSLQTNYCLLETIDGSSKPPASLCHTAWAVSVRPSVLECDERVVYLVRDVHASRQPEVVIEPSCRGRYACPRFHCIEYVHCCSPRCTLTISTSYSALCSNFELCEKCNAHGVHPPTDHLMRFLIPFTLVQSTMSSSTP